MRSLRRISSNSIEASDSRREHYRIRQFFDSVSCSLDAIKVDVVTCAVKAMGKTKMPHKRVLLLSACRTVDSFVLSYEFVLE